MGIGRLIEEVLHLVVELPVGGCSIGQHAESPRQVSPQ
jgi:hypothetical protein